ncbi:MAG: CHRD domain-containing protein [Nitrososphaerota archaeon]
MRRVYLWVAAALVVIAFLYGATAIASVGERTFKARLDGFQETPSHYTSGWGFLNLWISQDGTSITYELWYVNVEADVTAAHIHLGAKGTAGGVIAFLCGGGGKPACPARAGTVSGTITASDIIGPADQGIQQGQMDKVVQSVRAGAVYANIHTSKYPAGEIRGQLE